MNRLMVAFTAVALLASAWSAHPARAGAIIYNLDQISSSGIGSGTLGTVALSQNGQNEVDVAVTLSPGTAFVSTGGPHNAFVFNLDLATEYAVRITSPSDDSFVLGGQNRSNTPYGRFSYAIDCPGCGPGASHANPGPLSFKVIDEHGISAADFVANSDGFFFSADVIGPGGNTGNIAGDGAITVLSLASTRPSVPEPGSLPLLGAGVVALGCVLRQRRRPNARAGTSTARHRPSA